MAAQIRDRFHLVPSRSAWCQRLGCHSGYPSRALHAASRRWHRYVEHPVAIGCSQSVAVTWLRIVGNRWSSAGTRDQGRRRPARPTLPVRSGAAAAPPLTGPQPPDEQRCTVTFIGHPPVGSVAGSSVDTATARQDRDHDPRQWSSPAPAAGRPPGVWAGVTTRGPGMAGLPAPGCRQGPRPAGRRGPGGRGGAVGHLTRPW